MFHVWYMTYRLNHLQQLNGSNSGLSDSTAVRLNYAKGTRASELSSSIALCLNYAMSPF